MQQGSITCYKFDDFCLDLEKRKLLKNGRTVTLPLKAFQVLVILARHSDRIVEKEKLLSEIWPDSFVEESNLTQYVHLLRKALGQNRDSAPYIETINKIGYRFTTGAQAIFAAGDTLVEPDLADGPGRSGSGRVPVLRGRFHMPLFGRVGAGLVVAGLVVLLVYLLIDRKPPARIRSIAVLPFKPIDGEIRDARLGVGITDAIITRLSGSGEFSVRPTSAILNLGDHSYGDPVLVGRELGVDAVLEGSAQRAGDRIRITVRLIDVASGQTLWAEAFNDDCSHVFEMQDAISNRIAESLLAGLEENNGELLTRRAVNKRTPHPAANRVNSCC
jgi:DNA-binding winged helix-turn-helix (wHTH) protein/TolB-like protein